MKVLFQKNVLVMIKISNWQIYPRWLPDGFLSLGFVEKHSKNGGKSLTIITHVLYMSHD